MADDEVIWVSSIVSQRTHEGMVQVQWGGKACQLPIADARQLGMQFLEAAEAAESDAGIFHVLTAKVGAEEGIAYTVLQDIRNYRNERWKKQGESDADPTAFPK